MSGDGSESVKIRRVEKMHVSVDDSHGISFFRASFALTRVPSQIKTHYSIAQEDRKKQVILK